MAAQVDSKALKEIVVIDPTSRYGKLPVPMSFTFDTKGRTEWIKCNGKLKKDLSICCLFQKGKCHVGERCFQVHVDRSYVNELRKRYTHLTTCCHGCGDVHSDNEAHRRALRNNFPTGTVGISFGGGENVVELAANRLANTTGLEDVLRAQRDGVTWRRDGTPIIAFNKVCRLHLKNSCKYGKDCKNLHICYKVADQLTHDTEPLSMNGSRCDSRSSTPAVTPTVTPAITPVPSAAEATYSTYCAAAAAEDSLCPTPELMSRTSTPSWNSPIESCVAGTSCDGGMRSGSVVASTEGTSSNAADPIQQELAFLSRFQSHWPKGSSGASTESLQIIFGGGFPSVF